MENLSPSNDTLANGDDAHKGVMCAWSIFFKTSNFWHLFNVFGPLKSSPALFELSGALN